MSERRVETIDRPKIYVREKLSPAKAERFHATPACLPADLNDAYRRVRDATKHDAAFGAAWKLGGTTPTTRAAFAVDRVYFGCLHPDEILHEPRTASLGHLCEVKGEVEIALRLSARADGITPNDLRALRAADVSAQRALFDAWCIALEMPASAILNLPEAGVNALIADRCAVGCLILGAERPLSADAWQHKLPIVLEQDGVAIARGDVTNLVASPLECAIDFCLEALAHDFTIRAGQWISTGGLTPCTALACGHRITVRHGDAAVLDFDLLA